MQDAHANKLKQALPDKLAAQAAHIIGSSKNSLGLPGMDSSRVEATVNAALMNDNDNSAHALPRLPLFEPQQLEQRDEDGQQGPSYYPPQRTSRRISAKRSRDPDADVDVATLSPPKRVARMNTLYAQMERVLEQQKRLAEQVDLAKAELARVTEENDNLFAATAHIGAAMHAAIEERDAQAGAPSTVPSLGIEEPQQRMSQEQAQQPMGGPTLVPVDMPGGHGTCIMLTPGSVGLAALFSPSGDDLFAACDMFVSPLGRLPQLEGGAATEQRRGNLFQDEAPMAAALAMLAEQAANAPRPATSEDNSFSFRL